MTRPCPLELRDIADALRGYVSGEWVRAPGPGHSAADDSLAIRITGENRLFVYSHAGDDPQDCNAYVRAVLGGALHFASSTPTSAGDADRTARALQLWHEAREPAGTLVETYLRRRGLKLPQTEALRYHEDCPFQKDRHPAMLALVRDIVTDEPKAIHRTALNPYGYKVGRLSLGPTAGGAIKLFPVHERLGVGEGIETVLSMRALPGLNALPVWSVLSSTGLARFPCIPQVQRFFIAVDNDDAGRAAAEACLKQWGRATFVQPEIQGQDLNDAINGRDEELF